MTYVSKVPQLSMLVLVLHLVRLLGHLADTTNLTILELYLHLLKWDYTITRMSVLLFESKLNKIYKIYDAK